MISFQEWLTANGYGSMINLSRDPEKMNTLLKQYQAWNAKYQEQLDKYNSGEMSAIDLQGVLANSGVSITPEQTQWLNNEISQQVTNEARDYNTQMRDSSITSAADQLASLGLNTASVLNTGGAGIGSSPVADTSKGNTAQEKAMAQFNQQAAMTRTLVGVIGGMASAGVYGGSRILAQKALSACASAVAHSGLSAMKKNDGITKNNWQNKWNDMMSMFEY